ncbi:MAG: RagB/SusD family nutrient uptake outer membrane protein [Bacteroidales bacterium]|jgi:hypothetical protein|nr:RagB/SusD family nutrient uptake outer membrane protein [Bacteroidales bacterium]
MRIKKYLKYTVCVAVLLTVFNISCTKLDENVYDIIVSENFYVSKANVIQSWTRPFNYAYSTFAGPLFQISENTADHFMTPNRQGHWLDGQVYFRLHKHTWTLDDSNPRNAWLNSFRGVAYCNSAIADLSRLDPVKFKMTEAEMNNLIAQLRVLRAWNYINLLDIFRNVPIVTDYPSADLMPAQATPQQTFDFIETELLEVMPLLESKVGLGGNQQKQGEWNKAGAAALLVRLYLNAELWIGENHDADVITYAENIIGGDYGSYELADRWDAPFDWNNETCDEIIYGFPSSYGYTHYVYSANMYWWGAPFKAAPYFGFSDWGDMNHRFGLQPGLDLEGNEYPWANGKPVRKFMNYPDDVRLEKYRNLGNTTRRGMFLRESLDYRNASGDKIFVKADNGRYTLYMRDQVGWFEDTDTLSISPDATSGSVMISDMDHADQSSGWCVIKYPIYKSTDAGKMESDFALIRLAEIYYSLAEVKFRAGQKAEAEQLLNEVRERYYPEGSESLYPEDGSFITEQELLDEWGREFIGEGMRRTVLCRFDAYTGEWWDKPAETDDHSMIMMISRTILQANPNLDQNPGYPSN